MPRPAKRPARKQRLTELSVRKLKPETKAYLLWDTLPAGACRPGATNGRSRLEVHLLPHRPPPLAAPGQRQCDRAGRRARAGR